MTYHAKVIAGGKIVIPAELRRELGIKDGDVLVLDRAADGSLAIRTHMVDDFIADKRAEAERE